MPTQLLLRGSNINSIINSFNRFQLYFSLQPSIDTVIHFQLQCAQIEQTAAFKCHPTDNFSFFFRVVAWLIGDFVGNWFREEMLSVIDRSTWSRFLAVSWEKKKNRNHWLILPTFLKESITWLNIGPFCYSRLLFFEEKKSLLQTGTIKLSGIYFWKEKKKIQQIWPAEGPSNIPTWQVFVRQVHLVDVGFLPRPARTQCTWKQEICQGFQQCPQTTCALLCITTLIMIMMTELGPAVTDLLVCVFINLETAIFQPRCSRRP